MMFNFLVLQVSRDEFINFIHKDNIIEETIRKKSGQLEEISKFTILEIIIRAVC